MGGDMKKIITVLVMIAVSTVLLGRFSLGISVGLPGKITAQYQFNEKVGMDFSTAAFFSFGMLLVNANTDLLFFTPNVLVKNELSVNGYWGVGTGVTIPHSFDAFMLSVRFPLGIQIPVEFNSGQRCDAFLEITPLVFAFPMPGLSFTTSLGARYVF